MDFETEAHDLVIQKLEAGEWAGTLSGAPPYVWQSTIEEFTALPRKGKDPALSSELNWILQKTRPTSDGLQRIYKGNLPGHMNKRLRDWLHNRYEKPDIWLEDKSIKIDFFDDRNTARYIITHPFYELVIQFYRRGGVQLSESRYNYHGDSVQQAIKDGKPVPKKVLQHYAPYLPEAKRALSLGQDLFTEKQQELMPGLRRELTFKPVVDAATTADPVTSCMERLGWKIPRIEELRESISEKLTIDLITGKTKKLSNAEKEYQRVTQECIDSLVKARTKPKRPAKDEPTETRPTRTRMKRKAKYFPSQATMFRTLYPEQPTLLGRRH